jgi:hypothetical protein
VESRQELLRSVGLQGNISLKQLIIAVHILKASLTVLPLHSEAVQLRPIYNVFASEDIDLQMQRTQKWDPANSALCFIARTRSHAQNA